MYRVDIPLNLIKIKKGIGGPNGVFLREEVNAWLHFNVSIRGHDWDWFLKAGGRNPDQTEVLFKERDHALLFKLTWGGDQ